MATKTREQLVENSLLFQANSQKHIKELGVKKITSYAEILSWEFPKDGLLTNIYLMCTFKVNFTNNTDTSISMTPLKTLPLEKVAGLIRKFTLDISSECIPINVSGSELVYMNMLCANNNHINPNDKSTFFNIQLSSNTCASKKTETATFNFLLNAEVVFNQKELIGLIPLQTRTANARVTLDFHNPINIFGSKYGDSEIQSIEIEPSYQTQSIPHVNGVDILPDTGNIKNLMSETYSCIAGRNSKHLRTESNIIYRRILMILPDGMNVDNITSNIEILVNTNVKFWNVKPKLLQAINQSRYGLPEAKNFLSFDFTDNGTPNYGGTRDYIDARGITELWFNFTADMEGQIDFVIETVEII